MLDYGYDESDYFRSDQKSLDKAVELMISNYHIKEEPIPVKDIGARIRELYDPQENREKRKIWEALTKAYHGKPNGWFAISMLNLSSEHDFKAMCFTAEICKSSGIKRYDYMDEYLNDIKEKYDNAKENLHIFTSLSIGSVAGIIGYIQEGMLAATASMMATSLGSYIALCIPRAIAESCISCIEDPLIYALKEGNKKYERKKWVNKNKRRFIEYYEDIKKDLDNYPRYDID